MNPDSPLALAVTLLPALLMLAGLAHGYLRQKQLPRLWSGLKALSLLAAGVTFCNLTWLMLAPGPSPVLQAHGSGIALTLSAAWIACLVQCLGVVIVWFSQRYLEGEPRQGRYAKAIAAVLASVHVLLVADNWLLLIAAWSASAMALDRLLRFYPERPFAVLAAHKKLISDRVADVLLLGAAICAYRETGSFSLSVLDAHLALHGAGLALQSSAVLLVLAVAMRMALLPLHGWLIQVMEAPTPVSALLHAGVVNLGGLVLIQFAPLLEASAAARFLLLGLGLFSALVAGLVMLTRVSIKVRLAWSTLAQMGFMAVECGLGMYQLAMLHLIGHSLYKAQAFLLAGSAVRDTRQRVLRGPQPLQTWSLLAAPLLSALAVVSLMQLLQALYGPVWPAWWSAVLALAWAPLFWVPQAAAGAAAVLLLGRAALLALLLTALAWVAHFLPLGIANADHAQGSGLVLAGMALVYLLIAALQTGWAQATLEPLRRVGYAGLYLDDWYTRLVLLAFPPQLPLARLSR